MKDSVKDKVQGAAHQAKGAMKEAAGKAVGNPRLEGEGAGEKLAGKVQKKVGDIKKVFDK